MSPKDSWCPDVFEGAPAEIAAGEIDNVSMISAVDLLPTFCELAGVSLPKTYQPDGISQVATMLGTPYPVRETPLFWKFNSPWPARENRPDHWVTYAVVHKNWKLVSNRDTSYQELYRTLISGSPGVIVNGWTHSPLMHNLKWLVSFMEWIGRGIAHRRGISIEQPKNDNSEDKNPKNDQTGTFIEKLD